MKPYTCTLCEAKCGLEVSVEDNQIVKIAPDKQDVHSRGYMCPKGPSLKELVEDKNRLLHPVKKVEGQWVEISWQQALDETARAIKKIQKKYGKSAMGMYFGNPGGHSTGMVMCSDLLTDVLQTRNRYSASSLDQWPHMFASYHMFGHTLMFTIPDIDRTDLFISLGGNPVTSNGSIMTAPNVKKRLQAIQERGGQVIVIDPRRTKTAEMADKHYFIKPGSDIWLLLAMVNVMFTENRVNEDRLSGIATGLEALKEACRPFSTDLASEKTGIPSEDIRNLALQLADAKSGILTQNRSLASDLRWQHSLALPRHQHYIGPS